MPWLLPEGQTYDAEILAITRVRMLREFCLFLEALSREMPVVICVEDMHWGDHATVELMDLVDAPFPDANRQADRAIAEAQAPRRCGEDAPRGHDLPHS